MNVKKKPSSLRTRMQAIKAINHFKDKLGFAITLTTKGSVKVRLCPGKNVSILVIKKSRESEF